jgi:hypothetical protein
LRAVLPGVLAAVLGLGGCAASTHAPGVAALGSAGATASASPTSSLSAFQQYLAYSACMRAHGVADFPDPQQQNGGVGIKIQSTAGALNPNSPTYKAADTACKNLLPGGPAGRNGVGNGGSFDASKVPAWAECIRKHGVPNFPDPKIVSGGVSIDLNGTGINPNSLAPAIQACRSQSPGGSIEVSGGGGSK